MDPIVIIVIVIVVLAIITVAAGVKVIPQESAAVIERAGRFQRIAGAGLVWLLPFVDRIRVRVDLRGQVASFPPQPVTTADDLTVSVAMVVRFQVADPRAAVYQVPNYLIAVQQLCTSTLRDVVRSMDLQATLHGRDRISRYLRNSLDATTGQWGIRVTDVDLTAIEPMPPRQDPGGPQMGAVGPGAP